MRLCELIVGTLIHPLLLLLARATEKEAPQYIEYLKAENRILRSKLPKRVEVTSAEKATLIKLGQKLGSAIKELISIVHPGLSPAGSVKPRPASKRKKSRSAILGLLRQVVSARNTTVALPYRRAFGMPIAERQPAQLVPAGR